MVIALPGAAQASASTTQAQASRYLRLRDRDEARLYRQTRRALRTVRRNVERRLAQDAQQKALTDVVDDDAFWDVQRAAFQSHFPDSLPEDMMAQAARAASQAFDFEFDFGLTHQGATSIARGYTDEWWAALSRTSRAGLRSAILDHIKEGGSFRSLTRRLQPLFGDVRAQRIAATETTRLYAEGSRLAYGTSGVVRETVWQTVKDGHVEEICMRLSGTRQILGHENRVPPAHVHCRCWLAPVVLKPSQLTQAQSFVPQPKR